MYISESDLKTIKSLIDDKDVEMCGNLLKHDELSKYGIEEKIETDRLLLYVEVVGGLHSCQNKTYTEYQWHTHSKKSKGYPSAMDIFIPMRKRPNTSFVFTIFGIWQINSKTKYNIDHEEREKLIKKYVDPNLNAIYFKTEKGRVQNLDEKHVFYINHYIESLKKILGEKGYDIEMYFIPWYEITGNYELR